jgi:integrase
LRLAKLDDQIWEALRSGTHDVETARAYITETIDPLVMRRILAKAKQHHLSDALDQYLRKHQGRDERFFQNANRAFATVKDIIGNPALKDIKRANARQVLDAMLSEGLKTASVKRYHNTISAIFSVGILELELDLKNPFSGLTIPNFLEDTKDIPSFTEDELRQIATEGLTQKIEPGLIATMQIETGCRVAEIALLRTEDVNIVEHKELQRTSRLRGRCPCLASVLQPHGSPALQQPKTVGSSPRLGRGIHRAPSTAGSSALSERRRGEVIHSGIAWKPGSSWRRLISGSLTRLSDTNRERKWGPSISPAIRCRILLKLWGGLRYPPQVGRFSYSECNSNHTTLD